YEHRFDVELRAGERRVLLLADSNSYLPGPRRSPALPGLLGLTIGSGALAVGLGVGAAVIRDPLTRRGLAAGAAGSAGIAMIAGITALVLERRAGRSEPDEPRHQDCPGSPTLDKRIDLRVGPTLEQPAEFAELVGPRQELPSALVELAHSPAGSFPHPRGLVPPRRSSGSEAAADGERDLAAGEGQAGPQPLAL
ncbi:MAG: hypothetical protein KC431_06700, partial [Myxococcales bacterium]|nr:hypothetical protein [Myxococcales bacterium]